MNPWYSLLIFAFRLRQQMRVNCRKKTTKTKTQNHKTCFSMFTSDNCHSQQSIADCLLRTYRENCISWWKIDSRVDLKSHCYECRLSHMPNKFNFERNVECFDSINWCSHTKNSKITVLLAPIFFLLLFHSISDKCFTRSMYAITIKIIISNCIRNDLTHFYFVPFPLAQSPSNQLLLIKY